jgi:hypothetical protein
MHFRRLALAVSSSIKDPEEEGFRDRFAEDAECCTRGAHQIVTTSGAALSGAELVYLARKLLKKFAQPITAAPVNNGAMNKKKHHSGVSRRRSNPEPLDRGERYAMNETTNIVPPRQPEEIDDPLTDIVRARDSTPYRAGCEDGVETFLPRCGRFPGGAEGLAGQVGAESVAASRSFRMRWARR